MLYLVVVVLHGESKDLPSAGFAPSLGHMIRTLPYKATSGASSELHVSEYVYVNV